MSKEMTEAEARETVDRWRQNDRTSLYAPVSHEKYIYAKGILRGIKLGLNDGIVNGLVKKMNGVLGLLEQDDIDDYEELSVEVHDEIVDILAKFKANFEARKKEVDNGRTRG